ncbi:MAG TPA: hypothetical protein VK985_09475 [Rariglobus sp.]|nr:hypothetical protein [Rariglobus sp.]
MPVAPHINLAEWQDHFDFLLPRKEMLRPDEVGLALGTDDKTVIRLFESRRLRGHEVNAGKGHRQHRRYRRDFVILYLAETANYGPNDLRLQLLNILINQPVSELLLYRQAVDELIRRKQA